MFQQLPMNFAPQAEPPGLARARTDRFAQQIVDVSEQALDAGIQYKVCLSAELHDHLEYAYPGDPYESEIALWNMLMLAEFERTLNMLVPAFTFTASFRNGDLRLRYNTSDPVVIEIVHPNPTRRYP